MTPLEKIFDSLELLTNKLTKQEERLRALEDDMYDRFLEAKAERETIRNEFSLKNYDAEKIFYVVVPKGKHDILEIYSDREYNKIKEWYNVIDRFDITDTFFTQSSLIEAIESYLNRKNYTLYEQELRNLRAASAYMLSDPETRHTLRKHIMERNFVAIRYQKGFKLYKYDIHDFLEVVKGIIEGNM